MTIPTDHPMTWHRALLLALLLVGIGSVPVDAVNLHVGTGRALLGGKASGGGGGGTGNDLLVNTGLPMFANGTTPILVK